MPLRLVTVRGLLAALALLTASGCETIAYYAQSVGGHLGLMADRNAVETLIADPATSPELKVRLGLVLEIRAFASRELGLPDNDSYRSYVDTGRPYVVWNVMAAPEFSLQPKTWCFPVVGCLAYRGYFDPVRANRFAERLGGQGNDVFVGGVRAYSTLGWFDDPLLNTMLADTDTGLAAVIFHELAHQQLYIDGDTAFNESFAVAVEREGVRRWLSARGEHAELNRYLAHQAERIAFDDLLSGAREELRALYASPLEQQAMRAEKAEILERLERIYRESGLSEMFAGWFQPEMNNATLALVAVYWKWVPAFEALLAEQGGDLARFYTAARALGELSAERREAALESLLSDAR